MNTKSVDELKIMQNKYNINDSDINGSGLGGRILKSDRIAIINDYMQSEDKIISFV